MRFSDYREQLPPASSTADKDDREARRKGEPRDPMSTERGRTTCARIVASIEARLGADLDFPLEDWPTVVRRLARMSTADKAAISAEDLVS